MAGLESVLRIRAIDETGAAFGEVEKKIKAIETLIASFDKLVGSVGKTMRSADPLSSSFLETERALATQRSELAGVVGELDRIVSAADRAAAAQRHLARSVNSTTEVFARQGSAALRGAERVASAGIRRHGEGGHAMGMLPFAAPEVDEGVKKLIEAGASVEEEIARLKSAGIPDSEIAKARTEYREFSRTHAGALEKDYLSFFKDAQTIAPKEPHEMAALGARYAIALRNSGLPVGSYDVGNVMKIMDEYGFKTQEQREGFLGNFIKAQQAFGGSLSTETVLSAVRHAQQAKYKWSDEFRDFFFPTLLQATGEQGGTALMTAFNNYVGHHMQKSEIMALVRSGFLKQSDVIKDHGTTTIRDEAELFGSKGFKTNPVTWAWAVRDKFMSQPGATEDKFDTFIAKMPRTMAGAMAFAIENEQRFLRDKPNIMRSLGESMASDKHLADNPVAGLTALKDAIEQFAASVSEPAMSKIGAGLQEFAHGVQSMAAAYGDWAKVNPRGAEAAGGAAIAGSAAAASWLSWKMFSGMSKFFGFGGGAAEAAGGAAGGGLLGALSGALAPFAGVAAAAGPAVGIPYWLRNYHDPGLSDADLERSRRSGMVAHPGGFVYDPEAHRGGALSRLIEGGHTPASVQVDSSVRGEATINGTIRVEAGSELLRVVNQAISIAQQMALNPVAGGHSGRMDSDAAPLGAGGIGHR